MNSEPDWAAVRPGDNRERGVCKEFSGLKAQAMVVSVFREDRVGREEEEDEACVVGVATTTAV